MLDQTLPSVLICCPVPALHSFPEDFWECPGDVDFYPFKTVTAQPKPLRR